MWCFLQWEQQTKDKWRAILKNDSGDYNNINMTIHWNIGHNQLQIIWQRETDVH